MKRASTTKSIPCSSSRRNARTSARAVVPRDAYKRQFKFFGERRKVGAVAQNENRVGFDFVSMVCGHERLETMRFLRHHDGKALPAVWLGKPDFDFHAELPREFVQTGVQGGGMAIACRPRGLERHAELAAGDLFFERLDVGFLFEKEGGDARDDAGLVTPDDSDGGKLPHFWSRQTLPDFRAQPQLFFTAVVSINK